MKEKYENNSSINSLLVREHQNKLDEVQSEHPELLEDYKKEMKMVIQIVMANRIHMIDEFSAYEFLRFMNGR